MSAVGTLAQRIFAGLVETAGGVDASAAILTAAKGAEVHKSTVSRMARGEIPISIDAVCAMEDRLKVWPLTHYLNGRIENCACTDDLRAVTAEASVECGEAVAAVIAAFGPKSAAPTRMTEEERARAQTEVAQAIEVLTRLQSILQSEGGA